MTSPYGRTHSFIKNLGENGLVYLYIIRPELNMKLKTLTLQEFLCVLEQYLFFIHYPNINAVYVANPGVLQSPSVILEIRKQLGKPVYIYRKIAQGKETAILEHIYTFIAASHGSNELGFERT